MNNARKNFESRILSPYFVILFVIITLTIFFLILGNFKKYASEISIIVIPKSESLAVQSESLVQNFVNIPKTLSFYNRLLQDNSDIKDQFSGLDDFQRKQRWNENLKVEREKGSQIIRISVSSNNNDASKIARQIASTLFSVSAQYYNLKTDLDLRVIDGPINSSRLNLWFIPAIISLALGFILAFLINYILSGFEKIFDKARSKNILKNISEKFRYEKNSKLKLEDFGLEDLGKDKAIEKEKDAFFKPSKEFLKETSIKIPEKREISEPKEEKKSDEGFVKRGGVPANLPIAPSNLPIATTGKTEPAMEIKPHSANKFPYFGEEKIKPEEKVPEEKKGEPTDEEMKKRLNKLLKGEL